MLAYQVFIVYNIKTKNQLQVKYIIQIYKNLHLTHMSQESWLKTLYRHYIETCKTHEYTKDWPYQNQLKYILLVAILKELCFVQCT